MAEYARREQQFNKTCGAILGSLVRELIDADNSGIDKQIERVSALMGGDLPNLECASKVKVPGVDEPLQTVISIPPILVAPNTGLRVSKMRATMDMTTSAHTEDARKLDVGGSAEGKVGYGPFSLKLHADVSVAMEKKRSSDYTSTTHVELEMAPAPYSEGLLKVIDAITQTVTTGLKISQQVMLAQAEKTARVLLPAGPTAEPGAGA